MVHDSTRQRQMEEALKKSEAHFINAQRIAHVGSWEWDIVKNKVQWSDEIYHIFGLTPHQFGTTFEAFLNSIHPDDRELVRNSFREALHAKKPYCLDFRIVQPNASVRFIHTQAEVIYDKDENAIQINGTSQDITDRKKIEQRLCIQYTITLILSESTTLEEVIRKFIQAVCEGLEWDCGEFWTIEKKSHLLHCVDIWHVPSFKIPESETTARTATLPPGVGLPGSIWSSVKPIWIEDVACDTRFPRSGIARKEEVHGAFGFPILSDSEILGVVSFYSHKIKQPDEELLNTMGATGRQLCQFIKRKQAEDALNYRINFEKTVAKISTRFASLSGFNNAVSTTLADIGHLGDASRAYLFQFRENGKIMDNTHEWCKVGVTPEIQNLQNVPAKMAPWWMAHLRADKMIHITDVSQLPIEASAEKQILEMQDIKSLLVLPVYAEKELVGFIGFDNVITTGTWPEESIDLLRITAEILGNTIARKRATEALRHIAYHCPLTNLPNRMLFHDRLKVSINRAKRSKKAVAVMIIDLDSFKVVNDSFGHQMGDFLLRAVAKRLTACVREGDTIARMGGDEFMIVLPDIAHTQDVCIIAQKILTTTAQPCEIEGQVIHTTASMGISLFPLDAHDVDNLIKLADVAMYLSKEQGKNTYRFYNLDMNTHV